MFLSVSTLGCPDWSLEEILENLPRYDIRYVDFRGIGDDLDITLSELFRSKLEAARSGLKKAGLAVSGISSGINLCQASQFENNVAEAERTIELARKLDCVNVRMFGHGHCPNGLTSAERQEAAKLARECLKRILALPGADRIRWAIETHDAWQKPEEMALLLEGFPSGRVGVLWDIENYLTCGGGDAGAMIEAFPGRIFNVHVKDSVPSEPPGKVITVVPGTGDFRDRMPEIIRQLHRSGYDGFLTLEYEKRWQREIPGPEKAFPAYVRWMKQVL